MVEAESKEIDAVFADLFDPSGAEIYLKPMPAYVELGTMVSFRTVVPAARKRGEAAIGNRKARWTKDGGTVHGTKLNPAKSERVTVESGDRIIVVAES